MSGVIPVRSIKRNVSTVTRLAVALRRLEMGVLTRSPAGFPEHSLFWSRDLAVSGGSGIRTARRMTIWGNFMKIRQPLVLLLGGLLSSSSVGCATINAIVSEHRAGSGDKNVSAERMVAIGRVFENQGRLDQAEVMYRRALKKNPTDTAIRDQLQQLADKKNGRTFGAGSVESAIAMADKATGRVSVPTRRTQPIPSVELPKVASIRAKADAIESGIGSIQTAAVASLPNASFVRQTSAETGAAESSLVTAGEILDVVDSPNANRELLVRGLANGDSVETRCLAATLLGDCDPSDQSIRDCLISAASSETDPQLRLSIADSQIQREEATEATATCLIELLEESSEVRVQACSDLRYFAGTPAESKCITALTSLLDSPDDSLRTIGAVTLGDFASLDSSTTEKLKELSSTDKSESVRDAATSAVSRIELVSFEQ